MNLPIDTTEDCAFTIRVGYDAKCYAANVGLGGGITPQPRCAWCINCPSDGIVATILYHNHKGGWQNFLGVSAVQSSAVMEIWET